MLFDLQKHEVETTLTKRQAEYLEAYKEGRTASKAADIMGVSKGTAADQLASIAKKLGFADIRDVLQKRATDKATAKDLMRLIKKQDFKCALSGQKLTPASAELDHKIPRSLGGSDHIDNLQWLSREVNRMKGSMEQEEFVALCGLIWRHHTPHMRNDL